MSLDEGLLDFVERRKDSGKHSYLLPENCVLPGFIEGASSKPASASSSPNKGATVAVPESESTAAEEEESCCASGTCTASLRSGKEKKREQEEEEEVGTKEETRIPVEFDVQNMEDLLRFYLKPKELLASDEKSGTPLSDKAKACVEDLVKFAEDEEASKPETTQKQLANAEANGEMVPNSYELVALLDNTLQEFPELIELAPAKKLMREFMKWTDRRAMWDRFLNSEKVLKAFENWMEFLEIPKAAALRSKNLVTPSSFRNAMKEEQQFLEEHFDTFDRAQLICTVNEEWMTVGDCKGRKKSV